MEIKKAQKKLDMILYFSHMGMEEDRHKSYKRSTLNWHLGRATGAIEMAELLGAIDDKTGELLHDVVKGWYHFYMA